MNIRFLFFIIILIPTASAAECPKNIYYLTNGYVFSDGNLIFNFLDMDLTKPQIQRDFVSRPGELVTVEVKWTWGPNCPDCTVYVNSFGTWDPGNDISKLYSKSKGKETSVARVPITFLAPTTPGVYKFRVLFAYDKEYAKDFDASNLCSSEECRLRGECSILIAEGDINVTELGAGGKKPLSVELTSPKTSAVSGMLKTNVGAVIPIDAKILHPQNTSVNVTVRIDDAHVSDLLPYSWNTFNSTVGSHRILVTVNDENGTIDTDEIKVLLQNKTGTFGVIPPIIWGQRMKGIASGLDISEKGSYVVAGSNNGLVYLFDQTGKKIWEYDLSEPISSVAISSNGNNLIFSSGNVLYYLSNNGSMIWTYQTTSPIISTAINADGSKIASASGNVLYYLEKNGSLLWTYSTSSPIISTAINADGSRIASASGNVLYYLEKDGSLSWTYSSSTDIKRVAMNRNGDKIAFASGNVLYYMDNLASLLWNLSDVTDVAISSDGGLLLGKNNKNILAINSRGTVIWKDLLEKEPGMISVSSDGSYFIYSLKDTVFLRDNSGLRIPEDSRNPIYAAIAILVIVAAGIFIKRKKSTVTRKKEKIEIVENIRDQTKTPPVAEPVKTSSLKIRVVNSKTNTPIKDARILSGNQSKETDGNGEALIKDLEFGEHFVTVEKGLYNAAQKLCVIWEEENFIEISLIPKVEVSNNNEAVLKEAIYALSREYEKVSGYDTCLPNYYRNIGERIVEFLEMISYTPELVPIEEQKEFIDSFFEIGGMTCSRLLDVITDWRNVSLYKAASDLEKAQCNAKRVKVEQLLEVLSNPEPIRRETENRLSILDNKMMERMNELTIIPVSTLWNISKALLGESSAKSGYTKLGMVFFANLLLSHAFDMLENEEIIKRLKFALL